MIESIAGSRVKLKNHVYFGIVPDGILFDAGDASFVLKDKAAYPIAAKLIALIDAGNPVASILEKAPPKLAAFFQKMLGLLAEHGMLLAVDEDAPPAERLAAHTPLNELRKFLEDRLDGRAVDAALRRWHAAPVFVTGAGRALLAAVRALADSGCVHLTVVSDGAPTEGLQQLRDELALSHGFRFGIGAGLDDVRPFATGGMLVYASDDAVLAAVSGVERALRASGLAGAIGAVFDARACVLPAARPGHPGVADLLHWLPAQDDAAASLGPIAMSLLGCVTAQAAICRFFGVEAAASHFQAAFISPGLEVEYRMLVACAGSEGAPAPFVHPSKYQAPEGRPLLPPEQVKAALDPWFDSLLGAFSVVADDDIEQVPLLQYPIRVRSASRAGQDEIVVGWGLEHGTAALHGLSQAIEVLAQSFRRDAPVLVCEFDEERWKKRALAYAVAHSDEMARHHHWAWVDLDQLPAGPARVLRALLNFHVPDLARVQMQWSDAGDAFIARVLRADSPLCTVVAADPLAALTEALGQACSMFQLQQLRALRFGRSLALPAPDPAARMDDWQAALSAAQAVKARHADYHVLAAPGFPPMVYCGHASLATNAGRS